MLFQGFTAVDAYEKAGLKRHSGNASILARHPEIEARIEEIRAEAKAALVPVGTSAIAARAKVTAESLIEEAEEVRAGAVSNHQYAAANGAIKVKSVLSGNWIERAEIGGPGEFDHLSDAELEAAVRERLVALGWMPVPAITDGSVTLNGASDDE